MIDRSIVLDPEQDPRGAAIECLSEAVQLIIGARRLLGETEHMIHLEMSEAAAKLIRARLDLEHSR
jgi:hypothetical protein